MNTRSRILTRRPTAPLDRCFGRVTSSGWQTDFSISQRCTAMFRLTHVLIVSFDLLSNKKRGGDYGAEVILVRSSVGSVGGQRTKKRRCCMSDDPEHARGSALAMTVSRNGSMEVFSTSEPDPKNFCSWPQPGGFQTFEINIIAMLAQKCKSHNTTSFSVYTPTRGGNPHIKLISSHLLASTLTLPVVLLLLRRSNFRTYLNSLSTSSNRSRKL